MADGAILFVPTEIAETASAGFAGNEFTAPLANLSVRKAGEKGQSISFVVPSRTPEDEKKIKEYLAAIAKNSTDEFSVAKRVHKDCGLDKENRRVQHKGTSVIEFWKAPKITRKHRES